MAKRSARSQLTADNWDQEEEPEEAGQFLKASQNELKNRVFKKAKRKGIASDDGPSPFSAFAGFGGNSTKPAFGDFSVKTNTDAPQKATSANGAAPIGNTSFSGFSFAVKDTSDSTKKDDAADKAKSSESSDEGEYSDEYYKSLRLLNEGFIAWIQKHMSMSKYCIFTPVFKDYETHLNELETKYKIKKPSKTSTSSSGFSFNSSTAATPLDNTPAQKTAPFSFGIASINSTEKASGFSFNASKPADDGAKVADEEAPPQNDFKQVTEDDAFYSQKCKLYFKKDANYVEKGKGNLFLKKTDDDKTQLLIRADTNLGNILLNIFLSSKMPVSRVGKNNVMVVCVPNPPIDPKKESSEPTPMLIRVKGSEDADQLLKTIQDNQK